jgi:excisionase family DNA binding protein
MSGEAKGKGAEATDLVADGLVSVPEAQKFLGGISRSKLYEMMDRGELRYCKVGRNRRIPLVALRELAAKSLVG